MKLILSFVLSICMSASVVQGIGYFSNPFDLENYFMNLEPKKPTSSTNIFTAGANNQKFGRNADKPYQTQTRAFNRKQNNDVYAKESKETLKSYHNNISYIQSLPIHKKIAMFFNDFKYVVKSVCKRNNITFPAKFFSFIRHC